MNATTHRRALLAVLAITCIWCAVGCVNPLGPGYTIEHQQIDVRFTPGSPPTIQVAAEYGLKNTGNRPLSLLEIRLPGGRRVTPQNLRLRWDNSEISTQPAEWNPRNSVVSFAKPWTIGEGHTLRISFEVHPAESGDPGLSFANDAFFLPATSWAPEFPQERGLFGFGGTPPKSWELSVHMPSDFVAHTSGHLPKITRNGAEQTVRAVQTPSDHYPFVIAGRYLLSEIGSGQQAVHVWTREKQDPQILKQASAHIATITRAYDSAFGARAKSQTDLWIVECAAVPGCFSNFNPVTATLLGDESETPTAEMVSSDTLLVNVHAGNARLAATAGPGLAASWLGYGQNPGFYEQVPPLSQLPTFAAAVGREALEGSGYRLESIRRALKLVPKRADSPSGPIPARNKEPESDAAVRAKSFLFFYGLQDRFGQDAFRRAISEMLQARRGRGFNITDLIAAFDDETNQNAAEFVRVWMKRPGVPNDFRARYESSATQSLGAGNTAAQNR